MSSRPTTRCPRAARRVRTPLETTFWITDSVLANAFERYCRVSSLSQPRKRYASMPGPVEGRRRDSKRVVYSAKRQQTDVSPWKWKHPISESRLQSIEADGRHADPSMLSWVQGRIPPSQAWEEYPTVAPIVPAPNPVSESHTSTYPRAVVHTRNNELDFPPKTNLEDVLQSALKAVRRSKLGPQYHAIMDMIKRDIRAGWLSVELMPDALAKFTCSLNEARDNAQLVQQAVHELYAAVVYGVVSSRVQGPDQVSAEFLRALFKMIVELPLSKETIKLIQALAVSIPDRRLATFHELLLDALPGWLDAPSKLWTDIADTTAGSLNRLGSKMDSVLIAVSGLGKQKDDEITKLHRERQLRCLDLFARIPQVDNSTFADACATLGCFTTETSHEYEFELGHLLIRQIQSQTLLTRDSEIRGRWQKDSHVSKQLSLASLAWHIAGLERTMEPLESMFDILRRLDLLGRFTLSLQAYAGVRDRMHGKVFTMIAQASRDHRTAVIVYWLMMRHFARFAHDGKIHDVPEAEWGSEAWAPFVEAMIRDGKLHTGTVWALLGMKGRKGSYRARFPTKLERDLVANMSVWFAQSASLPDGEAARQVSRCNLWLSVTNPALPPPLLLALVKACIRDLERGEPGRPQRMNWMLDLVEAHLGAEEAQKTAEVLTKWRQHNLGQTMNGP